MEKQKKKGISIRLKLIGIIIPIVLVIIISFFVLARNVVLQVSKEELKAKAENYTGQISAWTEKIFGELQVYQDTINGGNFKDDAAILKYMETTVERNEAYPLGLYMGDDSGIYLDGSGWVPDSDWVLVERDWYVDGKDNATLSFGEPYYDSMTNQVCVSASVKMDYDKAVRVLATDVYLDYVSGLVSGISEEGDIEAFLVTSGTQAIIAHADTEMMAVTLDTEGIDPIYGNISKALAGKESGIISVTGSDGSYFACLNPVENTDWYLVTYVTERKMLSNLHWMEMYMFLIAAVAATILIIAVLRVMNRVVKPVQKVTNVIGQIAEGDFSKNLEVKGNDEIAKMSNDMQLFIEQMRNTISEIKNTADWLKKQSDENEAVSESLRDSSKSQAKEMDVLGQMANQLAAAAEDVNAQMEELAALIEQTHMDGENADELMKESVVMSKRGKSDMNAIHNGMANINSSITTLSTQVEKVGNATIQISDMVNIIMDIAEETNLLSLNASIEAARAGEAGRGFAVVAEQIGKLAANSSTAADDISRLTVEIRNTVDIVVEQMGASVSEVQKSVETVEDASETFDLLYEKVAETSLRVEEMVELVEKVNTVAVQMAETTESQMQVSQQIATSADVLDEHTKNVTAGSSKVAESAEELKKESVELTERMSKFTV